MKNKRDKIIEKINKKFVNYLQKEDWFLLKQYWDFWSDYIEIDFNKKFEDENNFLMHLYFKGDAYAREVAHDLINSDFNGKEEILHSKNANGKSLIDIYIERLNFGQANALASEAQLFAKLIDFGVSVEIKNLLKFRNYFENSSEIARAMFEVYDCPENFVSLPEKLFKSYEVSKMLKYAFVEGVVEKKNEALIKVSDNIVETLKGGQLKNGLAIERYNEKLSQWNEWEVNLTCAANKKERTALENLRGLYF